MTIVAVVATTDMVKARSISVRHLVYCTPTNDAKGNIKPALMSCTAPGKSPGLPHDQFDLDPHTAHFVVGEVGKGESEDIGSARLLEYNLARGLQAEHFAPDLAAQLGGLDRCMEASRVCLKPSFAGDRKLALQSLLGAMVAESIRRECFEWVATVRAGMLAVLSDLGVPCLLLRESAIQTEDHPEADGPASGEPLLLVWMSLHEAAALMLSEKPEAHAVIYGERLPLTLADYDIAGLKRRASDNISLARSEIAAWARRQRQERMAA